MIETAVKHGFREMREDPERSLRQLADLGKQFSKNRFQEDIFSVIQEALSNEDSAYYSMIENALNNFDETALETFGTNVGYNAWTCGARNLDPEEHRYKKHHDIPDFTVEQLEKDPGLVARTIAEKGYSTVYIHIDR